MTVYEIITNKMIKELEKGIIPWSKPWTGRADGAFNRISKKPYSFLNQCLLQKPGEYATMKQWNEAGGKVKKGEAANMVVFWKQVKAEVQTETGETVEKLVPMLRYYNVFHVDQVEGVEPLEKPEEKAPSFDPVEEADTLAFNYAINEGIKINHVICDRACYSSTFDAVTMPGQDQFDNAGNYYDVLFHELTHSTGHKKRLDRLHGSRFGSVDYAAEELVAEMGAAFCLNLTGIESDKTLKNNAAYIQSWIEKLKNDPKMVVLAASKAEKAVEYMKEAAAGVKHDPTENVRRKPERASRDISGKLEQIRLYIMDYDLSISQTAKNMGVSPSSVRRWITEAELIDPELYTDISARLDARKAA